MSRILNIEEVCDFKIDNSDQIHEGIKIETETERILFLIDSYRQCCENFGKYLSTPEDLKEYIGAEYLGYSNDSKELPIVEEVFGEKFETMFLNIHTSKGTIDFAVYNRHNGYYSHAVILKITDKATGHDCLYQVFEL